MRSIPAGLALSLALCGASAPVFAGSSSIWWPGWNIKSTEDLSGINSGEKPFPHPLSALFDANPRTTWVMNPRAKFEEAVLYETGEKFFSKSKRGLIVSGKSRFMSGLQIMNGDNSSQRAFQNGNRIRTLKITLLDGKKRHAYTLPLKDEMGWQRVAWPRQKADQIAIEFAELVDAKKPVCASGLGFLDGARGIKWNMPQAVMFWDGLEGCGSALLLNRQGAILDGVASDMGEAAEWSNDGRFVMGLNGGQETYLWVADAKAGRIIRKIYPRIPEEDFGYEWTTAWELRVQFFRPKKQGDFKKSLFQTKIYRF